MRRATHLIVLASFVLSCGGNWWVLQGVACAKMIKDYSENVSLAQAVTMTLSGNYPCPICKAIEEKKKSEASKIFLSGKYDKKFCQAAAILPTRTRCTDLSHLKLKVSFRSRSEAPPAPPPRPLLS